ncbi:MAG: WD40-like beta Propeller containing protein, partial [Conexibacter sp.]|nr:WD40-like beta Propeller containing protein [Conexibacter sp.]
MAHFARVTSIVLLTAAAALLGVCGPASAGGRPIFYSTIDAGTGRAHVWEMDADGSNRHQVTTDDASQQYSPSLSPDGEVVAYSSAIGSNQQVFTEPIGGGMIDDISNGTGSMVSESPSYCGDGSIVYLGDHAGNGLWDVYRGGVDVVDTQWPGPGGHAQAEYTENDVRCSRTGELSFVRYADAAHPLPSPDHGGSLTVELWTRGPGDPDVGVERTFLNATGTQQITTVKHASWSPDGNRIAFIATTQADGGDQLFTMRSDGADVTRVEDTAGGGTPRGVAWSPDGTQVAYVRSDGEIEEVTLAGDVDTEIADVTATGGLSWGGPAPPAGVPISEPAPALPTPPGAT